MPHNALQRAGTRRSSGIQRPKREPTEHRIVRGERRPCVRAVERSTLTVPGWPRRKSVLAGIRISFSIPLLPGLLATLAWAAPPATFESDIKPILDTRCVLCHGATAPQASLDLRSLESLLKGGKSGPAIVPGSAGGSILVEKLVTKSMPPMDLKLSDAEVAAIRGWIDAGAPSAEDESASLVTENDVLPIFQVRCLVCHGKREQRGGLDLRTRASRLRGGTSGPALVLGQPEESLLIQKIESGAMPPVKMQFDYAVRPPSGAELGKLKQWIAAGAPGAPPAKMEALKITAEDKTFWAFQPPQRPQQPQVQYKSSQGSLYTGRSTIAPRLGACGSRLMCASSPSATRPTTHATSVLTLSEPRAPVTPTCMPPSRWKHRAEPLARLAERCSFTRSLVEHEARYV